MSDKGGLTKRASIKEIIVNLFQNEQYKTTEKTFVTFARTDVSQTLIYPEGFTPLNIYIYYQVDTITSTSSQQLLSFATKEDKYIYGFYYNVIDQGPFPVEELKKSKLIKLSDNAQIIYSNYMEFYTKVNCIPIIVGLTLTDSNIEKVSVQYATNCKYYYSSINQTGLVQPFYPTTHITDLSRSLKYFIRE